MRTLISTAAIGLTVLVTVAHAAPPPTTLTMIPPQINYQGRLVTPANAPYADATHSIDLTLYPTASGGARIWSERYSVQTRDGYFSVNLGSGGTGLLATNLAIWQVLWNGTSGAAETNNFFMALTVRTDQNGVALASPVEATPRQQFLTAPFAYRAHQSVYARRADGPFDAGQGVITPSISTTNAQVEVNAGLKVANTLSANYITAQGASPQMTLTSAGGPLRIGMAVTGIPGGVQLLSDVSPTIQIGSQSSGLLGGTGSDVFVDGRNVDIGTTNLTVNNLPMFVTKMVFGPVSTTSTVTDINHGINTSQYDITCVGWYTTSSTTVRGAYTYPTWGYGRMVFNSNPTAGNAYFWILGIRKGLTKLE